jgi:poly(3-hydroxybutyrate) depolymerase
MRFPNLPTSLALAFLAIACTITTSAQTPGTQNTIEYVDGNIVRYLLYVPAFVAEEPDKKWPLIVFLHGRGERADSGSVNTDINRIRNFSIPPIIDQGLANGTPTPYDEFIVLTPQTTGSWQAGNLNTLIDNITANYPVDTQRIIVTGASMGAFGTYTLLKNNISKWAAAVPIAGSKEDSSTTVEKLKTIPLWIHHGTADNVVAYSNSVATYNAVAAAIGGPETIVSGTAGNFNYETQSTGHLHFTTYFGAKHDTWTVTHNRQDVVDWMFAQAQPGANAAPVLSLSTPASFPLSLEYGATTTLAFSASDSDGSIASIRVDLNGELVLRDTSNSVTLNNFFRDLIPGDYTLRLSAIDDYGRETAETHTFTIYITEPPVDSLAIIDNVTLNGSFEDPVYGSTVSAFWQDSLGQSDTILRELLNPDAANAGADALRIGNTDTGATLAAAINTGYTVTTGDSLYLNFDYRALDGAWDPADAIEWRLFTTSDNTRNGSVNEIASGSVSGYDDTYYRPFYLDAIGPAAAPNIGQTLWLEIKPGSGVGNGEIALIDSVRLNVSTSGSIDTSAPTPNAALWEVKPRTLDNTSVTMTAITGSDPSGGIEYYFTETSGNPGGNDSGWISTPNYTDTGLTAAYQYTYTVKMRDSLGNEGAESVALAVNAAAPVYTIQVDFEDKNATPTTGGNWNEIGAPSGSKLLKDSYGIDTTITLDQWVGLSGGSNDEADSFDYTTTQWGEAAQDHFDGNNDTPASFQLSGFAATETVEFQMIAVDNNAQENSYTVDGSFGIGGRRTNGEDYRTRNEGRNFGTTMRWTDVTGKTAYSVAITPSAGDKPVINALRLIVTPPALSDDFAPPIWADKAPAITNVTETSLNIQVEADETGTAYYVILADGAPAPSTSQIIAGTDANDLPAGHSGSVAFSAETPSQQTVTNLSPNTAFDIYLVAEDNSGTPNVQTDAAWIEATTLTPQAPVWTSSYPTTSSTDETSFNLLAQTDLSGTAYYVVLPDQANAPSSAQVKAGTDANDNAVSRKGSFALTAHTEASTLITGLIANTDYDIYIVAERSDANLALQVTPVLLELRTASEQPTDNTVIRLDFGEDDQAPKVGFADGGSWNTIDDNAADPNVDIAVGSATTELKNTDGELSGASIGSWVGTVFAEGTNNQDIDDLDGTDFNDGSNGDAGYDILNAASDGGSFGFTLSNFAPSSTVTVTVAAASKKWATNIADFTINGAFASNGGDDFDIYANSQDPGSGNATLLSWTLTGSSSYTFLMDAASTSRGAINGMIIEISGGTVDPDSDNDGLTDAEEATAGTDPNDPDSDGDGLSDGKEVNELGTDPNDSNSSAGGMDDLLYYALDAGSFASEGQSMPTIVSAGDTVEFSIPKTEATDVDYSIEISIDLSTWYRVAHRLNGAAWQKDTTADTTPVYPNINDISVTSNTTSVTISEPSQIEPRFFRAAISTP